MPTAGRENMGRAARAYYELHFERGRLIAQLEGWLREAADIELPERKRIG
jgi:hypothetical protein